MAMSTVCQTPGAQFKTHITRKKVVVEVNFGRSIKLGEEEAELLEANLHNVIEAVLAKYYLPA